MSNTTIEVFLGLVLIFQVGVMVVAVYAIVQLKKLSRLSEERGKRIEATLSKIRPDRKEYKKRATEENAARRIANELGKKIGDRVVPRRQELQFGIRLAASIPGIPDYLEVVVDAENEKEPLRWKYAVSSDGIFPNSWQHVSSLRDEDVATALTRITGDSLFWGIARPVATSPDPL